MMRRSRSTHALRAKFAQRKVEGFALLIGAVTSFGVVTATLYLTRGLNWYGDNAGLKTASKTA